MQLRAELGEGIKVSTAHRVCKRVGRSVDVSNLSDRGEAPEGREGDEAQVHELHQRGTCGVTREHEGGREGVREREEVGAVAGDVRSKGCEVEKDRDEPEYVDWCLALGSDVGRQEGKVACSAVYVAP